MTSIQPAVTKPPPMTGSERVRRTRDRRRKGITFCNIELLPEQRDGLIRNGLLKAADRDNKRAIVKALSDYHAGYLAFETAPRRY